MKRQWISHKCVYLNSNLEQANVTRANNHNNWKLLRFNLNALKLCVILCNNNWVNDRMRSKNLISWATFYAHFHSPIERNANSVTGFCLRYIHNFIFGFKWKLIPNDSGAFGFGWKLIWKPNVNSKTVIYHSYIINANAEPKSYITHEMYINTV